MRQEEKWGRKNVRFGETNGVDMCFREIQKMNFVNRKGMKCYKPRFLYRKAYVIPNNIDNIGMKCYKPMFQ